MTTPRVKPFPYDVVETEEALLFVYRADTASPQEARSQLGPRGLQIEREDGSKVRFSHLHPRVQEALDDKLFYACEVTPSGIFILPVDRSDRFTVSVQQFLSPAFYWFIGPETASLADVASRPLAEVIGQCFLRPVVVAPGNLGFGPPIGLCSTGRPFVPLASGRNWTMARPQLIVDHGFATGMTTGFSADDDIKTSVSLAHAERIDLPKPASRQRWSSQLACAFPADLEESA